MTLRKLPNHPKPWVPSVSDWIMTHYSASLTTTNERMCEPSTVHGTQRYSANGSFPPPHASTYLCSSPGFSPISLQLTRVETVGMKQPTLGQRPVCCSLNSFIRMKFLLCVSSFSSSLYPADSKFHKQTL